MRLADVSEVYTGPFGSILHKSDYVNDGVPLVNPINIQDDRIVPDPSKLIGEATVRRLGSYVLNEGDIVVARRGELGRCSVVGEREAGWICGTGSFFVRPSVHLNPHFFAHLLRSASFRARLEASSTGTTMSNLSNQVLGNLRLDLPPLPEQKRIVAILDEAFRSINKAIANTEKNLANARELVATLLESLFDQDARPGSSSSSLAELCELIVDCEHKTAPIQEDGIPSIRTPNIGRGRLLLAGVNRVSEATYLAWTRRAEPRPGDLILAREAPAGNVAVIPDDMRVCLGQRTVLIRPKRTILDPVYLAQLLLRRRSRAKLLEHSRGATVQHINMKDIRAFRILNPPSIEMQRRIVERADSLLDNGDAFEKTSRSKLVALVELKQSILQRAFAGELTARTAANALEAAE